MKELNEFELLRPVGTGDRLFDPAVRIKEEIECQEMKNEKENTKGTKTHGVRKSYGDLKRPPPPEKKKKLRPISKVGIKEWSLEKVIRNGSKTWDITQIK